jgi:serine/threonine-protein kinase HipA
MRAVRILMHNRKAGLLEEISPDFYRFSYLPDYTGPPISLTLPIRNTPYEFNGFPPFFDGLLPEGIMLEALLRQSKLDKKDYLGQLIQVGHDLVGAITVECLL